MAWTTTPDGVTVGGVAQEGTSTSTLVVGDGASWWLRLFGLDEGHLRSLPRPVAGATPVSPYVEGGVYNVSYLDSRSTPVAAPSAADLVFAYVSTDSPLVPTTIPAQKLAKSLDDGEGVGAPCNVQYQGVHVLDLGGGRGYLMVAGRYHTSDLSVVYGPGGVPPDGDNSVAAVVAFWSPDASFATGAELGPYWLVGRTHEIDGVEVPLWLSVPSCVIVEDGGLPYLYVYYVAEVTTYKTALYRTTASSTSFRPGVRVRRIPLDTLLAYLPAGEATWEVTRPEEVASPSGMQVERVTWGAGASGGGTWGGRSPPTSLRPPEQRVSPPTFTPSLTIARYGPTDEESWDASGTNLLPTEDLGKVRVWVPTGDAFEAGDDPAADPKGNEEIDLAYAYLEVVDPVAVTYASGFSLYFAAIPDGGSGTTDAYGVWRAAAIPADATSAYGVDFVVEMEGDVGLVGRAASPDAALDPDPVLLPEGTWVVFWGTYSERLALPLSRAAGSTSDGESSAAEAWA